MVIEHAEGLFTNLYCITVSVVTSADFVPCHAVTDRHTVLHSCARRCVFMLYPFPVEEKAQCRHIKCLLFGVGLVDFGKRCILPHFEPEAKTDHGYEARNLSGQASHVSMVGRLIRSTK